MCTFNYKHNRHVHRGSKAIIMFHACVLSIRNIINIFKMERKKLYFLLETSLYWLITDALIININYYIKALLLIKQFYISNQIGYIEQLISFRGVYDMSKRYICSL